MVPTTSIEVNLGESDPVEGFAFHIRGGDKALFVVAEIPDMLGLRALAPEAESGLFTVDMTAPVFAAWRADRATERKVRDHEH
jgi:hypothetical protein